MSVRGIELKEGQVWKLADPNLDIRVKLQVNPGCEDFPWIGFNAENGEWISFGNDGNYYYDKPSFRDLDILISGGEDMEENTYTESELIQAMDALGWLKQSRDTLMDKLEHNRNLNNNPEYQEYQRLKAKYE